MSSWRHMKGLFDFVWCAFLTICDIPFLQCVTCLFNDLYGEFLTSCDIPSWRYVKLLTLYDFSWHDMWNSWLCMTFRDIPDDMRRASIYIYIYMYIYIFHTCETLDFMRLVLTFLTICDVTSWQYVECLFTNMRCAFRTMCDVTFWLSATWPVHRGGGGQQQPCVTCLVDSCITCQESCRHVKDATRHMKDSCVLEWPRLVGSLQW